MIKRPFFQLTSPKLRYDLVEPDPKEPEKIPMPPRLILLLNEPLDSTRTTLIEKGDMVKTGERLFLYKESKEYVTSPCTGTITSIASYTGDFGKISTYFTVENNKPDDLIDDFAKFANAPDLESADNFLRSLPGDPPFKSLTDPHLKIHTLVITGTDLDLMSTTSQYFTATAMDEIKQGILILKKITGITKSSITISEKAGDIKGLEGMQVIRVSPFYPDALPEMIMKKHMNILVPAGKTCKDMGVCFISAEAVISIARAYSEKKPVYDKILTIIGKDEKRHRVKAAIGTPIHRLFKQFNLYVNEKDRIIIGGPMKGISTYTLYHPVTPDMDTIIIQDRDDIEYVSDYPCINCGKCINICPANIPVNLLVRNLEADMYEDAADLFDLNSCIECGLCSYVCTARIPLFQYIKLGKHELLRLESVQATEAANA
ncbi:MAG: 4Fe-4S dicluster domain-containing protein [Thermodesulfobacteriota bacterium]|nr:4Fe-4S dicluster domain-containing protein [Thermodesulfobacteriota bacterium]